MNTPNKITLSRLLLLPLIIFFYLADFIPFARLVSAVLFIVACLTDFLDGYLARKNNQVTTLGKFFDTIADKVLIMTGMILIIAVPISTGVAVVWPTWLGVVCIIIMLAREFIISALRQIAASQGIVLAAEKSGKIKATIQYVSVSLYFIYAFILTDIVKIADMPERAGAIINFILMIILCVATFLTIYSGVGYLIRNRKVFSMAGKNDSKKSETIDSEEESQEIIEESQIAEDEQDQLNENEDEENRLDQLEEDKKKDNK